MLFAIDFATEFSSFKVDPEADKYLPNTSNPILLMWHDEAPKPEVENKDKDDIENLGPRFLFSKGSIQHLSSIFDRHNFRLWDYVIDAQDSCRSMPANYKKICKVIQEKFGYQSKPW